MILDTDQELRAAWASAGVHPVAVITNAGTRSHCNWRAAVSQLPK